MGIDKKSPLKANPLRLPGQSVQGQIDDLIFDHIEAPYFIAAWLVSWAAYEWAIAFEIIKRPHPVFISVIAAIGVAFFIYKFVRTRKKIRALKQGRDGERAVGQFLEDLRRKGYFVFHDVIGDGFNLDHVVIGPKGIFTIETKTISKPVRGEPKIKYDGNLVTVLGHKPERNPIMQAKAQANWLVELIQEETGKKVHVKPVVVYPGWNVEGPWGTKTSVEVLNPKNLPSFIENYSNILNETDIHLFKSTVARRSRNSYRD